MAKADKPQKFVIFRPKKISLRVEPKLKKDEEIEELLETAGLDILEHDNRNQRYRLRLSKDDLRKHKRVLNKLFERAYREFNGFSTT